MISGRTLAAVLEGDAGALASLFSVYRDRLKRMVELRLDARLRGRVSASDILQEAYIGALQRLPHYQASLGRSDFCVASIGDDAAADRRASASSWRPGSRCGQGGATGRGRCDRAQARRRSPSYSSIPPHPASRLGAARLWPRFAEALDQLDPIDREVLVLRHFEQMSNHETAASLGIKPAAASKRYVRAVERLKSVLEQMPGFEGGAT